MAKTKITDTQEEIFLKLADAYTTGKSNCSSVAFNSINNSITWSTTFSGCAPGLSILFITTIGFKLSAKDFYELLERVNKASSDEIRAERQLMKLYLIINDVEVRTEKIDVPKSLTPEQVKKYLLKSIQSSNSEDEKRVFAQIVKWIDELSEAKKKLISIELEDMKRSDSEETPDDIE